jgi:hypothetical protein
LLVLAASGCFAPPAAQVALGAGARSGAGDATLDGPFQLRAGVHPLQLVHSMEHRVSDFGAGYLLDAGTGGPRRSIQGAYGEGSWFFFEGPVAGETSFRLGARGQGRLLVDGNGTVGPGVALQLTGELARWFKPACTSAKDSMACIGTEGAVGFYVETSYASLYATPIWSAGFGLVFRTPALFAASVIY